MKSLLERLDFLNDNMGSAIYEDADTCGEAAAAIRRLLARNAELLEALKVMVENFGPTPSEKVIGLSEARAAIAKAEPEKKSPGVL